jgi:hypothetical protein
LDSSFSDQRFFGSAEGLSEFLLKLKVFREHAVGRIVAFFAKELNKVRLYLSLCVFSHVACHKHCLLVFFDGVFEQEEEVLLEEPFFELATISVVKIRFGNLGCWGADGVDRDRFRTGFYRGVTYLEGVQSVKGDK